MEKQACHQAINNEFYDTLKDDWYLAANHPIALLRAENACRIPWIAQEILKHTKGKPADILDIGCGGGFLTNELAIQGHRVTGIDLSESSLEVAKKYDKTSQVRYLKANAYRLPFPDGSFDAACALDILEHVEDPQTMIREASRVLRPGGIFFFHTFNRNPFSYLVIIKGVEWFVNNTPKNMHVYSLFIKPVELKQMIENEGLINAPFLGFVPDFFTWNFWKLLATRRISSGFRFKFCKSLTTGYCGSAIKT